MNYLIIILLIMITCFELPALIGQGRWGEAAVVAALILVCLFYDLTLLKDWQAPNLKQGIEALFAPVTAYLEGFFT